MPQALCVAPYLTLTGPLSETQVVAPTTALQNQKPWGFSSVAQSCPILCDPMDHSTPGLLSIASSLSPPRLTSVESVTPSVAVPAGDCGHAGGGEARPPCSASRPGPPACACPASAACWCRPTAPPAPPLIALPALHESSHAKDIP